MTVSPELQRLRLAGQTCAVAVSDEQRAQARIEFVAASKAFDDAHGKEAS